MSKDGLIVMGLIVVFLLSVGFLLPNILHRLGLYPSYSGEKFNFAGKSVLVVTTSHAVLGETGKKTGVYASEMTVPYYEFLDAGMQVDVASINGGEIPIEPLSLKWPVRTDADKRYLQDADFRKKTMQSSKIDNIDFQKYDMIYMAGGWGAAYDLGTSEVLGKKISEANANGAILGSVCHGALGFLKAVDPAGTPFVKGRHMTAVSDKQVLELGLTITPQHPERDLRTAGALYECQTAFRDIFANLTVVDGNLVTGQNQNAGQETAQKMMKLLQHQEESK
jgi:putative intracellular protease/amidase